ncbi:hypothetical protein DFW101_2308 [Solidesulfovibrio carbinoliphilus subsp. oakridgensis]|uniref:Uncharacterized protein n=1 Tax=Solidesulfovibrio carbinoliphilus subsp. oakridgensis TaxID=694327 RepID=G7QAX2_9BACT|nr:hypothetical protein [Solidesulfovibrio carbinoliphilus]EHJ48313.1 hypothetical protein DFW101_2308 [Solidesulfovibrio carbinoliphilus subsp. oakridgensis]
MKKIVIFTVISCLLATSMAFAGTKKKAKKATKGDSYSTVEILKAKKKAKKATPAN